jgi:hypothetical protein
MEIIKCNQGSDAWWKARRGRPTASEFSRFINTSGGLSTARAKGDNGLSVGAKTYAAEKIAEGLGWTKAEFAGSPDIERGHQLESMARSFLAFELGKDVEEVGICISDCGRYAASPDGMIGGTVPIEVKCPDLHTQVRRMLDGGGLPAEYKAQVHGQMIVTGAPYSWFCSYVVDTRVPNILIKVERDEYTTKLEESIKDFCDRLEILKGEALL